MTTFWQVPPGTPFSQLPPEWRCPDCDGEKRPVYGF
ncbi:rubredoxin [Thiomicrorhabdus sp.]